MAESQPDTPAQGTDDSPAQDTTPTDLQAEVERLKGELTKARKWEDRAKANAKAAQELDQLKAQSMTEQEQAVAQARAEAAAEAAKTYGGRLVDAEVKTAAAGRSLDVDALLDGLDRTRFLTDDGEPDTDAIKAWVDRIAPQGNDGEGMDTTRPLVVDLGQGQRSATPALNSPELERGLKQALGIT